MRLEKCALQHGIKFGLVYVLRATLGAQKVGKVHRQGGK
jgi:hypothetical protein